MVAAMHVEGLLGHPFANSPRLAGGQFLGVVLVLVPSGRKDIGI